MEGNFCIGAFEEVRDFSDVWGHICESRPSGVAFGFCEWCCLGCFLLYLLFQSDDDDFWEVVILCDQQYGFPFLVLSVLVKREGDHPFYVVAVCC
jgi:hypothetical protein